MGLGNGEDFSSYSSNGPPPLFLLAKFGLGLSELHSLAWKGSATGTHSSHSPAVHAFSFWSCLRLLPLKLKSLPDYCLFHSWTVYAAVHGFRHLCFPSYYASPTVPLFASLPFLNTYRAVIPWHIDTALSCIPTHQTGQAIMENSPLHIKNWIGSLSSQLKLFVSSLHTNLQTLLWFVWQSPTDSLEMITISSRSHGEWEDDISATTI